MSPEELNILYVSADPSHPAMLKADLGSQYNITAASTPDEALAVLQTTPIQLIITDNAVNDVSGVQLFTQLMKEYPDAIRILFTSTHQINTLLDAINEGVIYKFLSIPYTRSELLTTISSAYDVYRLRAENKKLTDALLHASEKLNQLNTNNK